MTLTITPDDPYLYDDEHIKCYLTDDQIRSLLQLIDYEQLYECNDITNEHWNTIRRQLNESRQTCGYSTRT